METKLETLDLCFGNPGFLAPYWESVTLPRSEGELAYQHDCGIAPLQSVIKLLHRTIGNVKDPQGYQVVVGNGATQILQAAIYAYSRMGLDLDLVYAKAPFFQRFPRLTSMAASSVEWCSSDPLKKDPQGLIEIVTLPNNPDGDRSNGGLPFVKRKIYDLCYFWPQYGPVFPVSEDLMVFSLSKATGHASTRIGWALVKDAFLAKTMRDFIEHQTSDVSLASQHQAFSVLEYTLKAILDKKPNVFSYGRMILDHRWKALEPIIESKGLIVPNRQGMFLWGKHEGIHSMERWLRNERNVATFDGEWFGLDGKEWFRANIGCPAADFQEFIRRLW